MKYMKKGLVLLLAALMVLGSFPSTSLASLSDTSNNEFVTTKKTPTGKTGRTMTVSFTIKNNDDEDYKNVKVAFSSAGIDISDEENDIKSGYVFPFEVNDSVFKEKNIGTLKKNSSRDVTLTARVRRDIPEGYYTVPISLSGDDGFASVDENINIWISKYTGTDTDDEDNKGPIGFALGEGQSTPDGAYPNVMNFDINMRNTSSSVSAYDVTVSLVLSQKKEEFPFEINDANYDRKFERIPADESVSLNYSMAIQEDVYTGYYPIKVNITYRDSSDGGGDLKTIESSFYVRIKNKDKEDDLREFDANDRTKARLIVDSFETIPADVYAGEEFELILRMKNASASVPASNILFSLESEKITESAVFTTEEGSASTVVNQLGAGQSTELRVKLVSKAGIDQRSYSITIKEKFDSPEFKNAEESVVIDIPVKQTARLNTGTIEIMPESIDVGSETNVMFSINNTGKVILYNVMAAFSADSIQPADTYLGNIKPGESDNVDIMLTGAAPTMDEGKIKITITYEDENGILAPPVEKEMNLLVSEAMEIDLEDSMAGNMEGLEPEPTFFQKYLTGIIISLVVLAVIIIIIIVTIIRKKKKKAAEERELAEEEEELEEEALIESGDSEGAEVKPDKSGQPDGKKENDHEIP